MSYNEMLCITDAYGVMNVKQAKLQNTWMMVAFLIVFASIHCPSVQFPKQAHTFVHTMSFLARLKYFLHPHLL